VKLKEIYNIREGRETQRAKELVSRLLNKYFAEADKQIATGKRDAAATALHMGASEIAAILDALANDVMGGSKS
jgi:DNA-binding transcriptional MerR regulator